MYKTCITTYEDKVFVAVDKVFVADKTLRSRLDKGLSLPTIVYNRRKEERLLLVC